LKLSRYVRLQINSSLNSFFINLAQGKTKPLFFLSIILLGNIGIESVNNPLMPDFVLYKSGKESTYSIN